MRTRLGVGVSWNKCWGFVTWTYSRFNTVTTFCMIWMFYSGWFLNRRPDEEKLFQLFFTSNFQPLFNFYLNSELKCNFQRGTVVLSFITSGGWGFESCRRRVPTIFDKKEMESGSLILTFGFMWRPLLHYSDTCNLLNRNIGLRWPWYRNPLGIPLIKKHICNCCFFKLINSLETKIYLLNQYLKKFYICIK